MIHLISHEIVCKDVNCWTYVKELPNTRYLVSLNHAYSSGANMEIFDLSNGNRVKKIFSFEEVLGGINFLSSLISLITNEQLLSYWKWRLELQFKKKYTWCNSCPKKFILSPLYYRYWLFGRHREVMSKSELAFPKYYG